MRCGHYAEGAGVCDAQATGRYLTGQRCDAHAPAVLAGRRVPIPDPTRTLLGLRSRTIHPAMKGRRYGKPGTDDVPDLRRLRRHLAAVRAV